jgi:hypothetical protein
MFDLVTGSQYSLPSIFSDEIPTMSLRLCLIYVQNFFIPDRRETTHTTNKFQGQRSSTLDQQEHQEKPQKTTQIIQINCQ